MTWFFSSVWVIKCFARISFRLKFLEHWLHECFFTPVWIVIWCTRLFPQRISLVTVLTWKFSSRLIQFIIQTVIKYVSLNTQSFACNLRRLDLTGLLNDKSLTSYLLSNVILEGISNSTIDTFGPKMEIIADAGLLLEEINMYPFVRYWSKYSRRNYY